MPTRKKTAEQRELDAAVKSGHFMVAVWRVEGEQLNLYRKTHKFPVGMFADAVEMLKRDVLKTE